MRKVLPYSDLIPIQVFPSVLERVVPHSAPKRTAERDSVYRAHTFHLSNLYDQNRGHHFTYIKLQCPLHSYQAPPQIKGLPLIGIRRQRTDSPANRRSKELRYQV